MKHLAALLMISGLLALGSPALGQGPGERLNDATVRLLEVLQDRELRERGKLPERRAHLRTIVGEIVDWREMSRQVLSQHWEPLTQHERDEFTVVFGDIVQRSYIGMMEAYQGDGITAAVLDETIAGGRATVRTTLVSKSNALAITYRCIERENGWKIYDVVIDGISLLSNLRSQILRLTEHFGYGGMMKMLKMKQTALVLRETERDAKIRRVDSSP